MDAPPLSGTVHRGFEPVRDVFAELLRSGAETGAGLAVYRGGHFLVDLVGGWTSPARSTPWLPSTLVHTYSVSKPFAALAALTVVADGSLDLDAPLARAWPSYAAFGKTRTSLRDALSHRAAQPAFPDRLPSRDLYDAPRLESALAGASPEWEPGTAPAEHALTYGHLLSGVVRAATGRGMGEVFRRAVAGPLGLDAHFGVPTPAMVRVADLELSNPAWPVATAGSPNSLRWRALTRPPGMLDVAVLNGLTWRAGEFPAIGLHATAGAIARFYGELLDPKGRIAALLGSELYQAFLSPAVTGHDRVLDREVTWSLGLQVDDLGVGMGGIGGCDAYADSRHGFGYAYLTRRLADHARSERILASLEPVLGGA